MNDVANYGNKTGFKGKNLVGKRFGRLTVLEHAEPRRSGRFAREMCRCRCDCGNIIVTRHDALTTGHTKSCGCWYRDTAPIMLKKNLIFVDGTCVNLLKSNKVFSHNKSGIRGVSWNKRLEKWAAFINFKRKRYFLGYFDAKEEAAIAREKAEEKLYAPFLEQWEKTNAKK